MSADIFDKTFVRRYGQTLAAELLSGDTSQTFTDGNYLDRELIFKLAASTRAAINAAGGMGGGGGASLVKFSKLPAGVYQATLSDLGTKILTDEDADGAVIVYAPLFADAIAHGGSIRLYSTKAWVDGNTYIAFYPHGADSDVRVILGPSNPLYSLYSNNVGGSLELLPMVIDGGRCWVVVNVSGNWNDRY